MQFPGTCRDGLVNPLRCAALALALVVVLVLVAGALAGAVLALAPGRWARLRGARRSRKLCL